MTSKTLKMMSDGVELPTGVYNAFTEMVEFYEEGKYTVRTLTKWSRRKCCHYDYTTEIIEHTTNGDKLKAVKSLSD